ELLKIPTQGQQLVPACWSQPRGKASNRSWSEDNYSNWTHCDHSHWRKVPVMLLLLLCLCGMVRNRAVLWLLGFHSCRNPNTICVLTLAMAGFTFLLSITESNCPHLSLPAPDLSVAVTAGLNITILSPFPAGIYSLSAFSAVTALFVLPVSCWPCHALLWLLSFLLTVTLYFHSSALMVSVLSYLFSVLTLTCSGLVLLAWFLCSHFGDWLLLRVFEFFVFALSTSLLLACANSSAHPLIYFLAGSWAKEFTFSVSIAFQRAFENVPEPGNRDNTVESSSSGIIVK
uniref:MAS protein n=1 Tax=Ficedula albicollis TaxID=59894 RepID=A0A803VK35_FICAL